MGPPFGYRSEILFKRLLLLSLVTYFILSLTVELSPPLISIQKETKKAPRIVKLIEAPSKGREILMEIDKKKEEERRLAEERERQLEEERRRMEEKRLAEERRLNEERKRKEQERRAAEEKKKKEEMKRKAEERKRKAEERRLAEEKRRAEEAKRLAREKNREVAMNTGLLKALKGEKNSLDKIVANEEMDRVLAETSLKKVKRQPDISNQDKHPAPQKKALKGSEGIGDVPVTITESQVSSLSGKKGEAGIAIRHMEGGESLTDGGADLKNARSQQSIREVVASRRGGIDFVYKKALRNKPTLKGVIVIEFTISENGEVMEIRIVSSTIKDPSFEEQVLRRIRSWKFPPLPDSGNTIVTYPIEFFPV